MDDTVRENEYLLSGALDALEDAAVIIDQHHVLRFLNRAAERLLHVDTNDLRGCAWTELLNKLGIAAASISEPGTGAPLPGSYPAQLRLAADPAAAPLHATVSLRPIADPVGGHIMVIVPGRTVQELTAALDESHQQLQVTYERGMVGFFDWDVASGRLTESGYWVGRTAHTAEGGVSTDAAMLSNTHPDDVAAMRKAIVAHMKGETDYYEVEQRVRLLEGGYARMLVRGQAAACDDGGQVTRVVGTYVDVGDLRTQEARLQFALESSQHGIWEWDAATDTIIEHAATRPELAHYDVDSPLTGDRLARMLHPEDFARARAELVEHLRGAAPHLDLEMRIRRRDGTWGTFLVRGRALERDEHGRVHRVLGTYTEITDLKSQENRLQVALENARQGLWEWQPDADVLYFSPEWYALFGYPVGSVRSQRHDMLRIIHPDDIETGGRALGALLRGEVDHLEVEHRIRHVDGHYVNILSRGRVVEWDSHGRAARAIGTHVDITPLKKTQAELVESQRMMRSVFENVPQRIFWKNRDSVYQGCNQTFADEAGFASPEDVVGLTDEDMPWSDLADQVRADDRRILDGLESQNAVERYITSAAGTPIWVETTKVAIREPDGTVTGVLGTYIDITARLAREQQYKTVADAFTGAEQSRILTTLTQVAAEVSGADHAFVARFVDSDARHAEVTACFPKAAPLDDLRYDIADTPCEVTVRNGRCCVVDDVARRYPRDTLLSDLELEGYAGQRLVAPDGSTNGLFVLLFRSPLRDLSRVNNALDVFAARAAAELERERIHEGLRTSEQRLNAALESSGHGVWEWNVDSDEFIKFGSLFEQLDIDSGDGIFSAIHPEDRAIQRTALNDYFLGRRQVYEFEGRVRRSDGSYGWALVRGRAVDQDDDGRVRKILGTATDISALKTIQSELEGSRQFLQLIIDTAPQAIFWQDREFRYMGCNEQFAGLARAESADALIGKSDDDLWWRDQAWEFREQDNRLLNGQVPRLHSELSLRLPDGSTGWFDLTKVAMHDSDGAIIGILGAVHNVSERKQAEQAAQRLALFDPLTNLPNRRYFSERLEAALAASTRRRTKGALLFIDMDQFKQINDTLGHSVGDSLLQAVSERLQNVTRQEDTVARLGGDEFVVLLPEVADDFEDCARQAQLVADKIHDSLGRPFQFEHHQFHVTPTIGISLFPERGKGVDDVLKEADTAMYSGKAAGRNVTRFFRREMEQATQQRLRIEGDLRQAIENEDFELYYQPQVNRAGDVCGVEVLLRWHHAERGMIPPGEFIPIAEERGLIVPIGQWVLDRSFERLKAWLDQDFDIDEMSINVSSRQFRSEDFVTDVEALLARHRIPSHRVIFEITESTVMEDVEAAIRIMERLRKVGIRFAIDDFGVGYSSLSYLKRLPLDQLKIDRSFIADIGADPNDEIICRTIIAMSQHMMLQTIAEGVETRQQFEFLSQLRCNGYQGYLFLPPAPEDEFLEYLRDHHD